MEDDYKTEDYIQALNHMLGCIETKGVDNCSDKTQDSYYRIRNLVGRLNHDTVLYRP